MWTLALNRLRVDDIGKDREIDALLAGIAAGDAGASDRLFALLYSELRRVASASLRGERLDHTLRPTALVHETYLRLAGSSTTPADRRHLMALASRVMRRILVDYARARGRVKRGGAAQQVTLDEHLVGGSQPLDIRVFEDALRKLEAEDSEKARWLQYRHLAGLTTAEIATLEDVSERSVRRGLQFGRAWIRGEIERTSGSVPSS